VRACLQSASGSHWTICTRDGAELESDLLVDASGRHPSTSFLRRGRTVYDRLIAIAGLTEAAVSRTASDYTLIAARYDPLSGLGLLNSMKSAIEATPVILDMLRGQTTAAVRYEAGNQRSFSKYRQMHASYYSLERRWPNSLFWARRSNSTV